MYSYGTRLALTDDGDSWMKVAHAMFYLLPKGQQYCPPCGRNRYEKGFLNIIIWRYISATYMH